MKIDFFMRKIFTIFCVCLLISCKGSNQESAKQSISSVMTYDKLSEDDKLTKAISFIRNNQTDSLKAIIPYIKNINDLLIKDGFKKYSLLGFVCKDGNVEIVKIILTCKDIDINQGYTDDDEIYVFDCMYIAIDEENMALLKLLIDKGADINTRIYSEDGFNPLSLAVKNQNKDMVEFLLQNKANPDGTKINGSVVPLCIAVENNDYQIVKLLLSYNANPNQVGLEGYTAVNLAKKLGYINIYEALIENE